jgi:hypothetical protein
MKPLLNTETETDYTHVGDRVVRQFAAVRCPHCLRARLRPSDLREIGELEFAWTCSLCHRDVLTVTRS